MKKTITTPSPVVVTTVCSLCGLAWEAHGEAPTTEDCIRLLKAELAQRPPVVIRYPFTPYVPYVPRQPWWIGDIVYCGTSSTTANIEVRTPARAMLTCSSVTA